MTSAGPDHDPYGPPPQWSATPESGAPSYGPPPQGPPPQGPPMGYGWQAGPGQQFPPQAYGQPPGRTNGLAIASMVLGIVWIYWVGSVLALVFGYIARKQIRERGESGDGMAIAGIVLGWIGIGMLSLFFVFGAIGALSS